MMTAEEFRKKLADALSEAGLDDSSIPREIYRDAVEELIADLEASLGAVKEEIAREQG